MTIASLSRHKNKELGLLLSLSAMADRLINLILHFIKSVIVEVFIIFLFILLINNYLKNSETTIRADGVGYYDYLPSLFIHHDLARKDNDAEIILGIDESKAKHNYYWNKIPLLHFPEGKFDNYQTGVVNFEFNPMPDQNEKHIGLAVHSENYKGILRNVRLKFLSHKENI